MRFNFFSFTRMCFLGLCITTGANATPVPNVQTYKIQGDWAPSVCLDVAGTNSTKNGTDVRIWDCDEVTEHWFYDAQTKRIHAGWAPHMCLDLAGTNAWDNRVNIRIWNCDEVTERWEWLPPPFNFVKGGHITYYQGAACLDVGGTNATNNGAKVWLWRRCDQVTERFYIGEYGSSIPHPRFD